jgi:hypothetical protein
MNLEQVTELLPSAVIQIADLIGFPATEQLLSAFGGTTFPIGKGLRAMGASRAASCAILSAMRKPIYSSRIWRRSLFTLAVIRVTKLSRRVRRSVKSVHLSYGHDLSLP